MQNRTGKVEPRQEEQVQSSGRGEQTHNSGVSEVMGCDNVDVRQRRNVEFKVGADREAIPRTATLYQRSVAGEVSPGRIQHAGQRSALRRRQGSPMASSIQHLNYYYSNYTIMNELI